MKSIILSILISMSTISVGFASDSSILKADNVTCPEGYVLTRAASEVYKTVSDVSATAYSCHKMGNRWVDASVAGVRG